MPLTGIARRFYSYAPVVLALLFVVLFLSILRTSILGSVAEEKHVFFEITVLLLLAILAELAVVHLKQPSIMILLLLGILLSPGLLEIVSGVAAALLHRTIHLEIIRTPEMVRVFAQLGAIFLLFKVGLHSHFNRIFTRENLVVASLGVLLPFAAGYGYASVTGGNFAYSMFLGAALTATSVGVTVALLKEANLLGTRFADVIVGAAVMDDILGLLVLAFVINVSAPSAISALSAASVPSATAGMGALPLFGVLASAAIFLAGGVVAGRAFISRVIDMLELDNKTFLLVLAFLLVYAYVAEFIGLSSIVGAFLAGVLLNYSRHLKNIEQRTYALEVLFTPIFFLSLGMLVDIRAISMFLLPILVISAIAIASKLVGCGLGAKLSGLGNAESVIVGLGMAPRGEVALIVALLGLTMGVLTDAEYSIIASMALLTTLAVPPLLQVLVRQQGRSQERSRPKGIRKGLSN